MHVLTVKSKFQVPLELAVGKLVTLFKATVVLSLLLNSVVGQMDEGVKEVR